MGEGKNLDSCILYLRSRDKVEKKVQTDSDYPSFPLGTSDRSFTSWGSLYSLTRVENYSLGINPVLAEEHQHSSSD